MFCVLVGLCVCEADRLLFPTNLLSIWWRVFTIEAVAATLCIRGAAYEAAAGDLSTCASYNCLGICDVWKCYSNTEVRSRRRGVWWVDLSLSLLCLDVSLCCWTWKLAGWLTVLHIQNSHAQLSYTVVISWRDLLFQPLSCLRVDLPLKILSLVTSA